MICSITFQGRFSSSLSNCSNPLCVCLFLHSIRWLSRIDWRKKDSSGLERKCVDQCRDEGRWEKTTNAFSKVYLVCVRVVHDTLYLGPTANNQGFGLMSSLVASRHNNPRNCHDPEVGTFSVLCMFILSKSYCLFLNWKVYLKNAG